MSQTPITLSIAGSDSSGGAGIQADIKAISATGGYACTVITATTAQNTLGVRDVHPIPVAHVAAQLDAVFSDLSVQAVKIGMLATSDIIECVADKLRQYQPKHIVLDPVMVATSGDLLLQQQAIATLKETLLPLATLVTPNLPEVAALLNTVVPAKQDDVMALLPQLNALPCEALLIKGGHLADSESSTDWLLRNGQVTSFARSRIHTKNTHGTGCTLSSSIASYLAQGFPLIEAVAMAKRYLSDAIAHADILRIGQGHGPVHHFFNREALHLYTGANREKVTSL